MNWRRSASLGPLAEKFGLLFTVLGGLFSFSMISQLAQPFEAFGALALAMSTTAAGIVISITVGVATGQRFRRRVDSLVEEAESTLLEVVSQLHAVASAERAAIRQRRLAKRISPNSNGKKGASPCRH